MLEKLKNLFRRRVKTQDAELEQFRAILEVPEHFTDGFNFTSLVGTIFVALIMVPGSIYMELVAGAGIGGAAQWVTVLLFVEVAKRANAKMSRAQIYVLFFLAGALMGIGIYTMPIWTQFLVRSDAVKYSRFTI